MRRAGEKRKISVLVNLLSLEREVCVSFGLGYWERFRDGRELRNESMRRYAIDGSGRKVI